MKNQKSLLTIAFISMLTACSSTKTRRVAGVEKETIESTLPTMKEVNLQDLQNKKKDKLEGKEKEEFEKLLDYTTNKDTYVWSSNNVGSVEIVKGERNWVYKLDDIKISSDDVRYEAQDKGLKGYLIAKQENPNGRELDIDFPEGIFKENGQMIDSEEAVKRSKVIKRWILDKTEMGDEDIIKKMFAGTMRSFDEFQDFDQFKFRLLAYSLGKGSVDQNFKLKLKETNVLKTGANAVDNDGLNFSNFGVWESWMDFSGLEPELKEIVKYVPSVSGEIAADYYFFASGVENLKSFVRADINDKGMTFTGKTLAVVENKKDNTKGRLTGSATVDIDPNQAIGKLNLKFDDWYDFSLDQVDFSNKLGLTSTSPVWKISGEVNDSKYGSFKFEGENGNKNKLNAYMYGAEDGKATEVVGSYGIGLDDKFVVEGAFGLKKDN